MSNSEYPEKDIRVNIMVSEIVQPKFDKIWEQRYIGKYKKNGNHTVSLTTEETKKKWNQDQDTLQKVHDDMFNKELNKLNNAIVDGWCVLEGFVKIPQVLKKMVVKYSTTQQLVHEDSFFHQFGQELNACGD